MLFRSAWKPRDLPDSGPAVYIGGDKPSVGERRAALLTLRHKAAPSVSQDCSAHKGTGEKRMWEKVCELSLRMKGRVRQPYYITRREQRAESNREGD